MLCAGRTVIQMKLLKELALGNIQPMVRNFKKDSVYAIGAGSCFKKRLKGSLCSLGKSDDHEIYRLGKAMYVGFKL